MSGGLASLSGRVASLSTRLRTPHEIVGVFAEPGEALAAQASLQVFLRWALGAESAVVPPPVILLIQKLDLDPDHDRPRRADWAKPPSVTLEDRAVAVDSPRAKHARDVIQHLFEKAGAREVYERRKAGAGPNRVALALAGVAVVAAAAAAYALVARARP